jgi:hypothetical protein
MLAGLAWAETEVDRRPAIERTAANVRRWIAQLDDRDESDRRRIDDGFERLERALRREVDIDRPTVDVP